jgi:hypothetical protein
MQMHWRPDQITRTGVIEPMWIRQVSPVDMATHTIDPFIESVRGAGPAVSPYPSPEDIAYAAGKLAQQFRQGKQAVVCIGTSKIKVSASTPPGGGIVGTITSAAQQLARTGTVSIRVGPRQLVVCSLSPSGEPQVTTAAVAPPAPAPGSAPTQVLTRETPHTPQQQQKTGFGAGAVPMANGNTRLPVFPRPGNVPQYPDLDYAFYYRKINYNDNVWDRRQFQASIAQRYAPAPIIAMNQATAVPIRYAQSQAQVPLNTRAPMVMKQWPHPDAVWPRQASTSIAVRKEQRR